MGSRLIHAPLEEDAKIPAILPKNDENVKELVRHQHIREKHGGPVHVLCQIRQKYWILGGLTEVKSLIHRCPLCQTSGYANICESPRINY